MIDSNTKTDGEEFEAYNIRRWGSSGWTQGLKRSGRKVGANFNHWVTWPNTLKAHQLIAYVTDPGRQATDKPSTSECNAVIFDAMYECGANVSLVETLVEIGREKLGITEGEAPQLRTHLDSNAGAREVTKEIHTGRRTYGISGVPHFVVAAVERESTVGTPYAFSGAQESSTFVEMFEELAEKFE